MKKPFIESSLILAALTLPLLAFAQDFVPLTNLPGLEEVGGASSLPNFLNNLYRLSIGAAAVIAVLQIMRGGVYLMWNKGSITQNQRAKELIMNSIFGLVLVLSPAIVFGIINPDILKLELNTSNLQPEIGNVDIEPNREPLDRASGLNDPEEAQNEDPRGLSHTCTSPSSIPRLQTELDEKRETTSGGEVYLNIQSLGQGGLACCEAVRDTDGSSCRAGIQHSFGRGTGALTTSYICTCGN